VDSCARSLKFAARAGRACSCLWNRYGDDCSPSRKLGRVAAEAPLTSSGIVSRGFSGAFFPWIAEQSLIVSDGVHGVGVTELASSRAAWPDHPFPNKVGRGRLLISPRVKKPLNRREQFRTRTDQ
jgi:hypothetical protein